MLSIYLPALEHRLISGFIDGFDPTLFFLFAGSSDLTVQCKLCHWYNACLSRLGAPCKQIKVEHVLKSRAGGLFVFSSLGKEYEMSLTSWLHEVRGLHLL